MTHVRDRLASRIEQQRLVAELSDAYPQINDMTDMTPLLTPELHGRHYVRKGYRHHVRMCIFTLVYVFSVIRALSCVSQGCQSVSWIVHLAKHILLL